MVQTVLINASISDKEGGLFTSFSFQRPASSAVKASIVPCSSRSAYSVPTSNFKFSESSLGPMSESSAPSSVVDLPFTTPLSSQHGAGIPGIFSRLDSIVDRKPARRDPNNLQGGIAKPMALLSNADLLLQGPQKAQIQMPGIGSSGRIRRPTEVDDGILDQRKTRLMICQILLIRQRIQSQVRT